MRKSLIATVAVASITVLSLAACGIEEPAEVVEQAAAQTEAAEATPEATPEPEEKAEAGTAAIGDTVALGDWEVTVTKVAKNANDLIAEANVYNEKPQGQYVLVQYDATYRGDERSSDVTWDTIWNFAGADGTVYDEAYQVTQADSEEWPTEARQDGNVTQQIVFDVPKGAVRGGLLMVEDTIAFDYAEFPVS